jgi:hypothetical protein
MQSLINMLIMEILYSFSFIFSLGSLSFTFFTLLLGCFLLDYILLALWINSYSLVYFLLLFLSLFLIWRYFLTNLFCFFVFFLFFSWSHNIFLFDRFNRDRFTHLYFWGRDDITFNLGLLRLLLFYNFCNSGCSWLSGLGWILYMLYYGSSHFHFFPPIITTNFFVIYNLLGL